MPGRSPTLRILSRAHVRATAAGDVRLVVRYLGDDPGGCRVKLSLQSARRIPSRWLSRGRPRVVTLGTQVFTARAGAETPVVVSLSQENLALLRRMQTIRAVARATPIEPGVRRASARIPVSVHAPVRRPRSGLGEHAPAHSELAGRVVDRDLQSHAGGASQPIHGRHAKDRPAGRQDATGIK
jgi:hypothetical protein